MQCFTVVVLSAFFLMLHVLSNWWQCFLGWLVLSVCLCFLHIKHAELSWTPRYAFTPLTCKVCAAKRQKKKRSPHPSPPCHPTRVCHISCVCHSSHYCLPCEKWSLNLCVFSCVQRSKHCIPGLSVQLDLKMLIWISLFCSTGRDRRGEMQREIPN